MGIVSGVISDCGPAGNNCLNSGATGGSLVKTGAGTFTLFSNDLLGAYFQLAPNFFGQCLVYMGQYDSFICIFDLCEFILARVRSVFGKNFL